MFTLSNISNKTSLEIRLASKYYLVMQGKYVVLFFYPLDFTFVCPTEITAFSDRHGDFEKLNAEVEFSFGPALYALCAFRVEYKLAVLRHRFWVFQ